MEHKPLTLDEIDLPTTPVDAAVLRAATDETAHYESSFNVLRDVGIILSVLATSHRRAADGRQRPFAREEAILGGLLVRAFKLLQGLLQVAADNRIELANYYARGIIESAINIRYLISEDSLDAFDAYIAHSFRNDKRLLQKIESDSAARGCELPIETRIRESITKMLAAAGLELKDVPSNKTDTWPNFEQRLKALGLGDGYAGIFGGPSSYVHGTWHEIVNYHLREVPGGGYELDASWGAIRPQLLTGVTIAMTQAAVEYVDYVWDGYTEQRPLRDSLLAAYDNAILLTKLHEEFLNR